VVFNSVKQFSGSNDFDNANNIETAADIADDTDKIYQ